MALSKSVSYSSDSKATCYSHNHTALCIQTVLWVCLEREREGGVEERGGGEEEQGGGGEEREGENGGEG